MEFGERRDLLGTVGQEKSKKFQRKQPELSNLLDIRGLKKNLSISSQFSSLLVYNCSNSLWWSFLFLWISRNINIFSSFLPLFGSSLFFLGYFSQWFIDFVYLCKKPTVHFIDPLYYFLISTLFISALIFIIIFFLLQIWGWDCSCFLVPWDASLDC